MSDQPPGPATAGADAAVPSADAVEVSGPSAPVAPTGPAPAPTAVTPLTQEVRFATAMTGGVSLAIWMGGVARELNLLDQASRAREGDRTQRDLGPADTRACRLYRGLLELLDQVVRIDVLSGTSAGGINAVLLGLCHAHGVDLGPLRDLWFEAGDFGTLLRDPAENDPPSLLQGDRVLLRKLSDGIGELVRQSHPAKRSETVAFVTTALLTGETSRFTDSFGTLVPDVDHLAISTFATDDFFTPEGQAALALAARSSASFPAAFEPSFLPFDTEVPASADLPVRPPMGGYANITRSHWAADGGLLANRPIGPLLETIFERPADGHEVRRVLLYIVPDPGGTPDPLETPPPEVLERPYTLGRALISDLGAALNQSIAEELEAIRRHNERVDCVRTTRVRLAELGRDVPALTSDAARRDALVRESAAFVRVVVDRLMRAVTTCSREELTEAWRGELRTGQAIEEACQRRARESVSRSWTPTADDRGYQALGRRGRPAYDAALATVIGLIRAGYTLATTAGDRATLSLRSQRVHEAFRGQGKFDLDGRIREELGRKSATSLADVAVAVASAYADHRGTGRTVRWQGDQPSETGPEGPPLDLTRAWSTLADLVDGVVPTLRGLADSEPTAPDAPPGTVARRRSDARETLKILLDYLGSGAEHIAGRLLELYLAERSMLPVTAFVEQGVELVQVSANTRTALAPKRTEAKHKLTGKQLHHFGAFYKSSWRANDWMWGRLDGAGWLVHVLLDPRRILTVVELDDRFRAAPGRAEAFLEALAELASTEVPGPAAEGDPPGPREELAFLDAADPTLPRSLPATAMWLAAAWQREIAVAELPVVARQILLNPSRRDNGWALEVLKLAGAADEAVGAAQAAVATLLSGRSARKLRERMATPRPSSRPGRNPANDGVNDPVNDPGNPGRVDRGPDPALVAKLTSCPVPDEKLQEERGEPLLTRTVTKTVAVGTATLNSVYRPPASLKAFLATSRTVTLTGYRATRVTGGAPRWLILGGLVLAAGGFALAVQGSTLFGIGGTVAFLVGLYLVALGAWGWRRGLLPALVAVTVVVAVVALTFPWTREVLFGTGETEPGWIGGTVLPWLREPWWHVLVVVGVLVGLSAAPSLLGRFLQDRRERRRRPTPATGLP